MSMKHRKFMPDWGMIGVILALAWPTMLEQLLQTAVQYIDTLMVSSLGTQEIAAVGSTTTVNWLVGSSISALGVGLLAFIARAFGANEEELAKKAVSQAVLIVLTVGVFFTVLTLALSPFVPVWMQVKEEIRILSAQYFFILYLPMLPRTATIIFGTVLRASGDTKTPMKVGIAVNVINVVLNYLLIYPGRTIDLFGAVSFPMIGAGWGVLGAATASAVSFLVGGVYITLVLWRHPMLSPRGRSIRPDMNILKPCLSVALPNMLQRFATSLGYVAFAAMINSLGEISTAAHTIANTVESAFYIPGYGMQTAAATLAGNAYGAGDRQKMQDMARMFIPIEILLMIFSGGALFAAAPALMNLFADDAAVVSLGITVLRMVALSEPFYGFSIIVEGMMQGVGKTRQPFWYNLIGMWLVRIVGTYLCIYHLHMGLVSAWACMIAHNMLLFVLFMICYLRGTWNPLNQAKAAQG